MKEEVSYQEDRGGDGGANVGPARGVPHNALEDVEIAGENGIVPAEEDLHAALTPAGLLHEGIADGFWDLSDSQILFDIGTLPALLLDFQSECHVLSQCVGWEPASLQKDDSECILFNSCWSLALILLALNVTFETRQQRENEVLALFLSMSEVRLPLQRQTDQFH